MTSTAPDVGASLTAEKRDWTAYGVITARE
jgi:hypothetical protein